MLLEEPQLVGTIRRGGRPEMQQNKFPRNDLSSLCMSPAEIRQRKVWSMQRLDQPGFDGKRQWFDCVRLACVFIRCRCGCKRSRSKFLGAFLQFDAMIRRQFLKDLRQTVWPANAGTHGALRVSQAKEKFLRVLRQKAGTRLQIFGLAMAVCFHGDGRADRIAIALRAAQTKRDGVANVLHGIVQNPELRRGAVFENHFQRPS